MTDEAKGLFCDCPRKPGMIMVVNNLKDLIHENCGRQMIVYALGMEAGQEKVKALKAAGDKMFRLIEDMTMAVEASRNPENITRDARYWVHKEAISEWQKVRDFSANASKGEKE